MEGNLSLPLQLAYKRTKTSIPSFKLILTSNKLSLQTTKWKVRKSYRKLPLRSIQRRAAIRLLPCFFRVNGTLY